MKQKRIIECESCGFEGNLTYNDDNFSKSDITFCPCCGGDISIEYNVVDEEDDE